MELANFYGTCSMAELWGMGAGIRDEDLQAILRRAKDGSRKAIIVNLNQTQYNVAAIPDALRKAGFIEVGTYYGNSSMDVHVFLYGVKPLSPTTPSKPPLIKRAIVRTVRARRLSRAKI